MSFNLRLLPQFLLFAAFLYATLNGLFILKTGSFTRPFYPRQQIEGKKAIVLGVIFLIAGLWFLFGFIASLSPLITLEDLIRHFQ